MSTRIKSAQQLRDHPYTKAKRKVANQIYELTENKEVKIDLVLGHSVKIHYIGVGGAKVRIKNGDGYKTMGFMTVPVAHLIDIYLHLKLIKDDSSNTLGPVQ